jgi:hypothetical protein
MTTTAPAQRAATDRRDPAARVPKRSFFVRSLYVGRDLQLFLVTAVATILIVRAALAATGWPQLGGGKIHFAHLLWGGLGMLIALILFMSMEGRLWKVLATFAAGVGFGLFIDELGKFITSDNDYFFQPTIAIIYVIFVVLLLVARAISHNVAVSQESALVNAFDLTKEAVIRDMDEAERGDALAMLERCDRADPVVRQLTAMVRGMAEAPKGAPGPYLRLKARLSHFVRRLSENRWFRVLVVGWYVALALVAVAFPFVAGTSFSTLDFAEKGQLLSAFATGVLVIIGIVRWRRSRLAAYRWFERAILVTLFIYEFFAFYQDQLTAVFGLAIVLITYMTIRLLVDEEQDLQTRLALDPAPESARGAGEE